MTNTDIPLAMNLIFAGSKLLDSEDRISLESILNDWASKSKVDKTIYDIAKNKDYTLLIENGIKNVALTSSTVGSSAPIAAVVPVETSVPEVKEKKKAKSLDDEDDEDFSFSGFF